MKKTLLLFVLVALLLAEVKAQPTRYLVRFRNKGATTFTLANPAPYLSARAISRRTKYGIAIDSTDLPVPDAYVTQVKGIPNVTVLTISRWMNAVSIQTTAANAAGALSAINALPFVSRTDNIAAKINPGHIDKNELPVDAPPTARVQGAAADYFNYGASSYNEIHLHNGEFLHNIGLRGQGMQIAMLDGGFFNYTTLRAFDSINMNGQVLGTWDFVNREASVAEDIPHGMQCLSTIAANIPGQFVGKAPKASFYLFRTEDDATEYPIEEFNWVCGAERADSSGADIISSSLGYNTFDDAMYNHTYSDMNGNTTVAAIGADLAAKKGLLVFNSAGNDGLNSWKYIATPADADSIVAVGSVNVLGTVAGSSSYGPSSDGQIKPDVASVGVSAVVQNTNNTIGTNNGTSFAGPNMAGLGTCLWQGFPEYNNMKIIQALRQAGSIAATPNDRIGYGIPNMKTAFINLLREFATSTATASACKITINWSSKDIGAMRYEVERKAPGETVYSKIADVASQPGVTFGNHSYSYDNMLTNVGVGTISYRIRQVLDTATASFTDAYIDTANVALTTACTTTATSDPDAALNKLYVVPNPASNDASLVIDTPGIIAKMPVAIYDMKGRLIIRLAKSKGAGKTIIVLPANQLPAGRYIIKVYNGQKPVGTTELLKL